MYFPRHIMLVVIPVAIIIGIWWLSRNPIMTTKLKGLIFAALGFGLAYLFRNDQGEGAFMCLAGIVVGVAGVYFFFDGLKKEIIAGINPPQKNSTEDKT